MTGNRGGQEGFSRQREQAMQRPRDGTGPDRCIRGIANSWIWLEPRPEVLGCRDGIEGVPNI